MKVRASSWASLFDCAHKWEGVHLLGMCIPSTPRAQLGRAIHASTAVYDQSRIDHSGITPSDAAGALVDELNNTDEDVQWDDDLNYRSAEKIGLTLHTDYCTNFSPKYEFVAVELTAKPLEIDCGDGVIIQITGTLDRSRIRRDHGGKIGISDLKSGAMAVQKGAAKTKGHAAQIGTYELLTEHTMGQPVEAPGEIIGLKTKGKLEIATGEIVGARDRLVGTDSDDGLIAYAAEMFRSGMFPPNPQSLTCSEKYCPRWHKCKFHD